MYFTLSMYTVMTITFKYMFLPSHFQEAERAKAQLNGKVALGKKLVVDWARPDLYGKKIVSVY